MTDVIVSPGSYTVPTTSYVECAPIVAGAVVTLGVSLVLLSFGSAIGLAVVSPFSMAPVTSKFVWGAAFWLLLVLLWSFSLGGYVAGRMRHRWPGASQDEVEFRDGAHGLVAWAGVLVLGALIAAVGTRAAPVLSADPISVAVDHLYRANLSASAPAVQSGPTSDMRMEAARLLISGPKVGTLSPPDRTYLGQLVASRTGLSTVEAEGRVAAVTDELKVSLEKARRVGIVVGFLTSATLLVAAAAAWWAAVVGGGHRDQGVVWDGMGRKQQLWFMENSRLGHSQK